MRIKPDTKAPYWLRKMAERSLNAEPDMGRLTIRVTDLIKPAHMVRLEREHEAEIEIDPIDMIPAMLGNAWHEVAALDDDPAGMSEFRIMFQVGDWMLSGKPDYFDDERIIDRKLTKCWSKVYGKPEWEQQLNLYHWLVDGAISQRSLEVHAVYVDWTENAAKRNPDFPQSRFEVIEVNRWPQAEVEAFIDERLTLLEANKPPICLPDERWERMECWAVMKKGRKRAVKLHDEQEAAEFAALEHPDYYVEHRPGDPIRCRSWCSVAQWCAFGREVQGD